MVVTVGKRKLTAVSRAKVTCFVDPSVHPSQSPCKVLWLDNTVSELTAEVTVINHMYTTGP